MTKKDLSRRSFLQYSAQSILSLGLINCSSNYVLEQPTFSNISSEMKGSKGKKIAIIGAGMSGISAAYQLKKEGFDVTIFEGRDRLGGRVFSKPTSDAGIAEIGAGWIHGNKGNPLIDLCEKFGFEHVNTYENEEIPLFDSKSGWMNKGKVANLRAEYEKYIKYATDISGSNSSVEDLFWKKAGQTPNKEILKHILRTTFTDEYAAEASLVTSKIEEMEESFEGGNHVVLNGYSRLVESLANGLDYKLNTIVKRVLYKNNTVQIQTNKESYNFDACVATVPLGVLKKGSIEFSPALPEEKTDAIKKIGFGHFSKLIMTFPEVFWNTDSYWIEYFDKDDNRLPSFFNAYTPTKKNMLIAIAGGKNALEWQSQGLDKMVERAVSQLKKMYGNSVANPTSAYLSEWSKDPFSYGAYSYLANGSTVKDIDNLAKPVSNTLFFAGEACHKIHMSTVHGAYVSGIDVSKKIFAKY